MSIRKPAARKFVRQLLELPLYRLEPLSDTFIDAMAEILVASVDLDEQHARTEALLTELKKGK